jgi:GWxTD domain-containing protein
MRIQKLSAIALICLFLGACGISLVPSKDDWYAMHYYIMQDFEWKLYKDLSPAARLEFQKLFWASRSPEAKQEFDNRVAYTMKAYKKENSRQPYNVDRAHVYLLNGSPVHIELSQNDNWATRMTQGVGVNASVNDRSNEDVSANTLEVWTYPYDKYLIRYTFYFRSPNEWRLDQAAFSGNRYMGALEEDNKLGLFGVTNPGEYKAKLEQLKSIK